MNAPVFLGLGSNVGNRLSSLKESIDEIAALPGTKIVRVSPLYKTSPVGPKQREFLNAVAEIRISLRPAELLRRIKTIEKKLGRRPRRHWGPREIDIDILLYGTRRIRTRALTIPHLHLSERKFVLWPLSDLAPKLQIPGLGKTVAQLRRELTDPSQRIRLYKTVKWTKF